MIAIGLSPNTENDDVLLALSVLFTPWRWIRGGAIKSLEDWFKRYFQAQFAISFDSGRSAEYAILKALNINGGDEILLQSFTCVAVPNSVLWAGAVPIYVDIDESGNIDPKDLCKKITEKSRAIIVQHTLGVAANMDEIVKIAKEKKLVLIEDCAHSLGATYASTKYKEKKLGTFGDFAFFSFGRDKVISSVFGGMAITNNKRYAKALRAMQKDLSFPSFLWVVQQLLHPISFVVILPLYELIVGKVILFLLLRLHILSLPVDNLEKQGKRPSFYPRRLPNAQAILALNQARKLDIFNAKRRNFAAFYTKELQNLPLEFLQSRGGDIFMRFNTRVDNPKAIHEFARRKRIYLGLWYGNLIDPKGVDFDKVGYMPGSCPNAEEMARMSLNLPTYPRMKMEEAGKVVETLKEYFKQ